MNAITKNIPNSITCLNLLSGCFACLFAYKGEYDIVALCIGLSALFDFLDGMAARLLHAYSPMGKELDSLADLISFGLAPGFMAMHFMLYDSVFHGINDSYQIWWALSALLSVRIAWRVCLHKVYALRVVILFTTHSLIRCK